MTNPDIFHATLEKLAGSGAFDRGLDYFNDGAVVQWEKKRNRVVGIVQGNQTYSVTLELSKQGLDGFCDCPASDGVDFCKHCVALALQYQSETQHQEKLAQGDSVQRIQAHLESLPKDKLVGHLLDVIKDDRELKQHWSIAADVALGKVDSKNLKKRITGAFPLKKHLFRYPQVRSYFAHAEPVIELLQQQVDALPADKALELVDYALDRLHQALSTIDDSGGFRETTQALLINMQFDALERIEWDKPQLATYVLALFDAPVSELLPPIPNGYAEILDDEGMDIFLAEIRRRWDPLPALKVGSTWEDEDPYRELQYLLMNQARVNKDLSAMIDVSLKTATETKDFSRLCELCMEYNDWAQAQLWLDRAKQVKPDKSGAYFKDNSLARLQIRISVHNKDKNLALETLWSIFKSSPSIEDYRELKRLSGKRQAPTIYTQATSQLMEEINKAKDRYTVSHANNALFEIYLEENKLDDSLTIIKRGSVKRSLCLELARRLVQQGNDDHVDKAFPLYQKMVEDWIDLTSNDGYRNAIVLLQEMVSTFIKSEGRDKVAALIADVRLRYKAKRNFIKYLDAAKL